MEELSKQIFDGPILLPGFSPDKFKGIIGGVRKNAEETIWTKKIRYENKKANPKDNLKCLDLFTYALLICEDDPQLEDPETVERLEVLVTLAEKMQISSGEHKGQFYKKWADYKKHEEKHTQKKPYQPDTNMVEFCMRGATVLWQRREFYQKELPGKLSKRIRTIMSNSFRAVKHKHWAGENGQKPVYRDTPPKYTNVYLLNILNLILLGNILGIPDLITTGYRRFDQFMLYTWEWGIHEYCSPIYTGIQLNTVALIERFGLERRKSAKALLEFYWTYIVTNWIWEQKRMGGTNSRQPKDFMENAGRLDYILALLTGRENLSSLRIITAFTALSRWRPSHSLLEAAWEHNMVRHSWGPSAEQSRVHHLYKDITLSVSGSKFDLIFDGRHGQDMPLTVDLRHYREVEEKKIRDLFEKLSDQPEEAKELEDAIVEYLFEKSSDLPKEAKEEDAIVKHYPGRCYFVADDEDDPYGQKGTDHLSPTLWVGSQTRTDALGLVLYSPDNPKKSSTLNSHFIMPLVSRIWGSENLDPWIKPRKYIDQGWCEHIPLKDAIALCIYNPDGTYSTVGVKVMWARNLAGDELPAIDYHIDQDKSNHLQTMRLTVDHSPPEGKEAITTAGALFWVRVGSSLTGAGFLAWLKEFQKSKLEVDFEQTSENQMINGVQTLRARGTDPSGEAIEVCANLLKGKRYETSVLPPFSKAVLDLHNKDVGRKILENVPVIASYERLLDDSTEVRIPADGKNVYWEAERGRVWLPMTMAWDNDASGGWFVWMDPKAEPTWQKGSDVGSVAWRLHVSETGSATYYLWCRVKTPPGKSGAFTVRFFQGQNVARPLYLVPWKIEKIEGETWRWIPFRLNQLGNSEQPSALMLPSGSEVRLQMFAKRHGTRIDSLFLTSDPNASPPKNPLSFQESAATIIDNTDFDANKTDVLGNG